MFLHGLTDPLSGIYPHGTCQGFLLLLFVFGGGGGVILSVV